MSVEEARAKRQPSAREQRVAANEYDLKSLKKVGEGSTRVVYDLGDGRVLKRAKNPRGLMQNDAIMWGDKIKDPGRVIDDYVSFIDVAPTFFDAAGIRLQVLGSYYRARPSLGQAPRLYWQHGRCRADCVDGQQLELTRIAVAGEPLDEAGFLARFGTAELDLT